MAGPGIPILGVALIALLAVEPGVDPGASVAGDFLAEIVGFMPAAGFCKPQGLKGGGEPGGGLGIGAGGAGEVGGVHRKVCRFSLAVRGSFGLGGGI